MHSTLVAGLLLAAATNALPAPQPQLLGNLVGGLGDVLDSLADGLDGGRDYRDWRDYRDYRDGRGYGGRGWRGFRDRTAQDPAVAKITKRNPQILGPIVDGLANGVGSLADGVGDVVGGVVGGLSDGVGGVLEGVAGGVGGLFDALLGGSEYGGRGDHYRAVNAVNAVNKAKVAELVKRNPQIVGPILETVASGLSAFGLNPAADIVDAVKDGLTGGYGTDEDDWSSYFPDRKVTKRSPQIVGPILESVASGLGAFGLDPAADIVDAVNDGLTGGYDSDEDDYYRQVAKRAVKENIAKRSPQILSSLLEGLSDALSYDIGGYGDDEDDTPDGYYPRQQGPPAPLPLGPLPSAPSAPIPVESLGPLDSSFSSD